VWATRGPGPAEGIDLDVHRWLLRHRSPALVGVAAVVTRFGSAIVVVPLVFLGVLTVSPGGTSPTGPGRGDAELSGGGASAAAGGVAAGGSRTSPGEGLGCGRRWLRLPLRAHNRSGAGRRPAGVDHYPAPSRPAPRPGSGVGGGCLCRSRSGADPGLPRHALALRRPGVVAVMRCGAERGPPAAPPSADRRRRDRANARSARLKPTRHREGATSERSSTQVVWLPVQ